MHIPNATRSSLYRRSQFLRLALQGVVLAYFAGALFVIALEFQAAVPSVSTTFALELFAGFVLLEATVIGDAFQIFKSISR